MPYYITDNGKVLLLLMLESLGGNQLRLWHLNYAIVPLNCESSFKMRLCVILFSEKCWLCFMTISQHLMNSKGMRVEFTMLTDCLSTFRECFPFDCMSLRLSVENLICCQCLCLTVRTYWRKSTCLMSADFWVNASMAHGWAHVVTDDTLSFNAHSLCLTYQATSDK